jgi:hypothetical protein
MSKTKPAPHIDRAALEQLKDAHKSRYITRHQFRTLRGQIFAGDATGAMKGLRKLLLLQGSNAIKQADDNGKGCKKCF